MHVKLYLDVVKVGGLGLCFFVAAVQIFFIVFWYSVVTWFYITQSYLLSVLKQNEAEDKSTGEFFCVYLQ